VDAWLDREPDASSKLGATLLFLRTMTLTPDALGPADARAVYAAGVSRAALDDAVHVAMMFNLINRIADGLGFDVPDDAAFADTAKALLRFGYEL
jgi:alkylhydroperoxidase family enzyme